MTHRERRDGNQSISGRRLLENRRNQKRWGGQERRTQTDRRQSIS